MTRIQIYTTRWCGYCVRAKALLDDKGIPYDEVSLDDDPGFRSNLFDLRRYAAVVNLEALHRLNDIANAA